MTRSPQHTHPSCHSSGELAGSHHHRDSAPKGIRLVRGLSSPGVADSTLPFGRWPTLLVGCLPLYSSAHDAQMKICWEMVPSTGLVSVTPQLRAMFNFLFIPGPVSSRNWKSHLSTPVRHRLPMADSGHLWPTECLLAVWTLLNPVLRWTHAMH